MDNTKELQKTSEIPKEMEIHVSSSQQPHQYIPQTTLQFI
jgi:hypothetical protein